MFYLFCVKAKHQDVTIVNFKNIVKERHLIHERERQSRERIRDIWQKDERDWEICRLPWDCKTVLNTSNTYIIPITQSGHYCSITLRRTLRGSFVVKYGLGNRKPSWSTPYFMSCDRYLYFIFPVRSLLTTLTSLVYSMILGGSLFYCIILNIFIYGGDDREFLSLLNKQYNKNFKKKI